MTADTVDITPMNESHIPGFRQCLDTVARERKYLMMLKAPPLEDVITFITPHIKEGHPQFVAVKDSRVIGWCDAFPIDMPGYDHVARLGMGLLPDYRRKGIGSRLMRITIEAVRSRGLEKIELDVYASNRNAIALYEKFGFEVEGTRRRKRKVDGVYDDQVLMGLFL